LIIRAAQDLLRVARAIFTTGGDSANIGLAKATHNNVIKNEIRALKHRAMADASSLDIPATPDLVGLLSADDWPFGPTYYAPQHLTDIGNFLSDLSHLWAGKARQRFAGPDKVVAPRTAEICDSFLVGLYFCSPSLSHEPRPAGPVASGGQRGTTAEHRHFRKTSASGA